MLYHHTVAAFALMTAPLAAQELVVVTDIAPVHSLTAQVMEGVGTPEVLVGPGASPHNFALRPSQARALQNSTAVFWIGPDLTPWLEGPLDELAQTEHKVALLEADGVLELPTRDGPIFGEEDHDHDHEGHDDHAHDDHDDHAHEETAHKDHDDHDHAKDDHDDHGHDDHAHDDQDDHGHKEAGHDDHAHDEAKDEDHAHDEHAHDDHGHEGHAHGAFDPHGWMSPDNAALWLTVIADTLSEAAPEHAETFQANATAAQAALEKTTAEIEASLAPVKDRGFIVFHDAYQYFEQHFGLNSLGSVAYSDATAPSPKRIEELRAHIREEKPACAFTEPQLNTGLLDTVLEGEGVKVSVLDPLGSAHEPGPALYGALMRDLAQSIATCAD